MLRWFKKRREIKEPAAPVEPSPSHAEMIQVAKAAVDAYDDYLEQNPIGFEIRDVNCLPGPKSALVNAVRIELMFEQDERVREFLIEIGLKLALFREGIGEKELSPLGLPVAELAPRNLPDGAELSERILAAGSSPEYARHAALMEDVSAEWKELADVFDQSIALAKRMALLKEAPTGRV